MDDLSFEITGPDFDGFVWLHSHGTTINLGKKVEAVKVMANWLSSEERVRLAESLNDIRDGGIVTSPTA